VTPRVGDLFKLKVQCLGNPAGTVGVGFNAYDLGEGPGIQLIFPNGEYDGFSPTEQRDFLEPVGHCDALSAYHFSNVIQVAGDFRAGHFGVAWPTDAV
jgi:hypothetical protein